MSRASRSSALIRLVSILAIALLAGCAGVLPQVVREPSSARAASRRRRAASGDPPLAVAALRAAVPAGESGAWPLLQASYALDARLALIENARSSLDLQYYLIADDSTGHISLRGTLGNFIDFDVMLTGSAVPELGNWFDRYWNITAVYPVQDIARLRRAPDPARGGPRHVRRRDPRGPAPRGADGARLLRRAGVQHRAGAGPAPVHRRADVHLRRLAGQDRPGPPQHRGRRHAGPPLHGGPAPAETVRELPAMPSAAGGSIGS